MEKKIIIGVAAVLAILIALVLGVKLIGGKSDVKPTDKAVTTPEEQETARELAHERLREAQQKYQEERRQREQFVQEGFNSWFKELAKAYDDNDMEKVGQLIKKMKEDQQRTQRNIEEHMRRSR